METYWPEIKKLEQDLKEGKTEHFKEFIDLLAKEGQLNEHMYGALCDCCYTRENRTTRWSMIHEFAKEKKGDTT